MAEEDERELLRKLEPLRLEVWPVLSDPGFSAPLASAETRLVQPAYYLAAGDVTGYPIKKGPERGKWKIDEVLSPVIFLQRSLPDEHGELRSGYFWAETEAAGDNRSEEHTSELQSRLHLVCRLLLEKKKKTFIQ